jgi:hypothetical protein
VPAQVIAAPQSCEPANVVRENDIVDASMEHSTTSQWQSAREPLRDTLLRNGIIAISIGFVLALLWGGLARWPIASLLALWPSLGGHWLEVWFLNRLRHRLPAARTVQTASRVVVWFMGGTGLAIGIALTAMALGIRLAHWPPWWLAGAAFIGIELVAHLALQARGRPSFYNGRG